MVSYVGAYFAAIPAKNDEVRLLLWHVAIDAITSDWARHFRMALAFMAAQAMFGKCDQDPFGAGEHRGKSGKSWLMTGSSGFS